MKRTIAARIAAMFLAGGLMMGTAACGSKSQPQENSLDAAGEPHEEVTISILHEHSAEAAENIVSSAGFRAMLDKYQ